MWRHPEKNSSLALIVASSGLCIKMNFSVKHNLQVLLLALKDDVRARILHLMAMSSCRMPSSFKAQMYPANLVWLRLSEYLKSVLWFRYLDFQSGAQTPTYFMRGLVGAVTS